MIKSQTGLFSMRNVFLWTTQPDRDGPFAFSQLCSNYLLSMSTAAKHCPESTTVVTGLDKKKKTNRYSP